MSGPGALLHGTRHSTIPAASTTPRSRRDGPLPGSHANERVHAGKMTLVGPIVSSLACVSSKSERRAAREVVADYHDAQLGALVARLGEAVDRYRAGELDPFEVDRALFQYSRAAKELWKFCNYLQVDVAAAMILEQPPHDWWERGAPRER